MHVETRAQKKADVHVSNYGGRKCTKLVLKPLEAKNGISILDLCIAPFLYIKKLFQFT